MIERFAQADTCSDPVLDPVFPAVEFISEDFIMKVWVQLGLEVYFLCSMAVAAGIISSTFLLPVPGRRKSVVN